MKWAKKNNVSKLLVGSGTNGSIRESGLTTVLVECGNLVILLECEPKNEWNSVWANAGGACGQMSEKESVP